MKKLVFSCLTALGPLVSALDRAHAAFVLRLSQAGGNVVVNGSGTLNATALTLVNSTYGGGGSVLLPASAILAVNPGSGSFMKYSGLFVQSPWSSGGPTSPTTASGSVVAISGSNTLSSCPWDMFRRPRSPIP